MKWSNIKRPLTIPDIIDVEKQLNIHLPKDYKQQIGSINGGALRNAYIAIPGVGEVPYERNISLHRESPSNIYDLIPAINQGDLRYFPFASVGDGDMFCFDLDRERVVLYLHEENAFVDVCASFTQLLKRLIVGS